MNQIRGTAPRRQAGLVLALAIPLAGCMQPHLDPLPQARPGAVRLYTETLGGFPCFLVDAGTQHEVLCDISTVPFAEILPIRKDGQCPDQMRVRGAYCYRAIPGAELAADEAIRRLGSSQRRLVDNPSKQKSQDDVSPWIWRNLGHYLAARDAHGAAYEAYLTAYSVLNAEEDSKKNVPSGGAVDGTQLAGQTSGADDGQGLSCTVEDLINPARQEKAQLLAAIALAGSNLNLAGSTTRCAKAVMGLCGTPGEEDKAGKAASGTLLGYAAMLHANARDQVKADRCAEEAIKRLETERQALTGVGRVPAEALARFGRQRDNLALDISEGVRGNDEPRELPVYLQAEALGSQIDLLHALRTDLATLYPQTNGDGGGSAKDQAPTMAKAGITPGRAHRLRAEGSGLVRAPADPQTADTVDTARAGPPLNSALEMMGWLRMEGRPLSSTAAHDAIVRIHREEELAVIAESLSATLSRSSMTLRAQEDLLVTLDRFCHRDDGACRKDSHNSPEFRLIYAAMAAGPSPLVARVAQFAQGITVSDGKSNLTCNLNWYALQVTKELDQISGNTYRSDVTKEREAEVLRRCGAQPLPVLAGISKNMQFAEGEQLIGFVMGPQHTFGLRIDNKGWQFWRVGVASAELTKNIDDLLNLVADQGRGSPAMSPDRADYAKHRADVISRSAALYNALFPETAGIRFPVDTVTDDKGSTYSRWIIAATGPLARLPFGILVHRHKMWADFSAQGWVGRDVALVFAPSLDAGLQAPLGAAPFSKVAHCPITYNGFIASWSAGPEQPPKLRSRPRPVMTPEERIKAAKANRTRQLTALAQAFDNAISTQTGQPRSYKAQVYAALGAKNTVRFDAATKSSVLDFLQTSPVSPDITIMDIGAHSDPPGDAAPGQFLLLPDKEAADASRSHSTLSDKDILEAQVGGSPNPSVVLLSSCYGNRGLAAGGRYGEPFSGPVHAFLAGGTTTVTTNAWEVRPKSAARLTADLLLRLHECPDGVIDLARAAQLVVGQELEAKTHLGIPDSRPSNFRQKNDAMYFDRTHPATWGALMILGQGWAAPTKNTYADASLP